MGSFSLVALHRDLFFCVFAILRAAKPLAELPKVSGLFFCATFLLRSGGMPICPARWEMLILSPSSWESQGDG